MGDTNTGIGDLLGIKPLGKAVEKVTAGVVDGASAFLGRICLPAAEEFGLLLKDKVQAWRANNLARTLAIAEQKLNEQSLQSDVHADPRIVSLVVDAASWIADSVVQDMWGGLLASSCTESGDDDSNLLYTNLLSNLTKVQARILNFSCQNTEKRAAPNGLIIVEFDLRVEFDQLKEIAGENDVHRLDCELDHLRHLGLLAFSQSGFDPSSKRLYAGINPTSLAVQMYVRCQGSRLSPIDFFNVPPHKSPSEPPTENGIAKP